MYCLPSFPLNKDNCLSALVTRVHLYRYKFINISPSHIPYDRSQTVSHSASEDLGRVWRSVPPVSPHLPPTFAWW